MCKWKKRLFQEGTSVKKQNVIKDRQTHKTKQVQVKKDRDKVILGKKDREKGGEI